MFAPEGVMAHKLSPVVGHWYENTTAGERFEVVAVDADDDIIVIRFDSSDMEELDRQEWRQLALTEIDPDAPVPPPTVVPKANVKKKR
jgi:Family of unknown function (DUF6763)